MIKSTSGKEPPLFHTDSTCFYYVITNYEGWYLEANSLFKRKYEIQNQQFLSNSFRSSISPDHLNRYQAAIEKCTAQQSTVSAELRHQFFDKDDELIYWEVSMLLSNNDQQRQLQWIGLPVSEHTNQKKTTEEIIQSEQFFRALIVDSLDGMILVNEEGTISFASESVTEILGYYPDELINKNAFDFVHSDDLELCIISFQEELNNVQKYKFIGIRLLHKSGDWLWCMVRGHNQISNPAVRKMLIYFCDDSYRRDVEMALIESRERFYQLIQNLNIGIIVYDADGRVQMCNQSCLDLVQVKEDVMIGRSFFEINSQIIDENGRLLKKDEYPIAVALRSKLLVKNRVIGVNSIEKSKTIWLNVNVQPVLEKGNNLKHIICSFLDITEQKNLALQLKLQEQEKQKQLMQATINGQERERSEISRELHDNISQHLTTTRLYLEVLKEKTEGYVSEMITDAHKGLLQIINDIRNLSQTLAPPELNDIGLIESVLELCNQLRRLHSYRVEFEHNHFEEDGISSGMKLMLYRIIQEQINNIIRHAEAGIIIINLQTVEKEVKLIISDDGKGFDAQLIKKGLGLTNILNRVSIFDGHVEIITSPGNGCFIEITAPIN